MTNYIKIRQGVSPSGNSFGDDVLQVKRTLNALGYYDKPTYGITEYADKNLFSSIRNFQKDNGLKIDGILKPDGETQKTLDKELGQKLGARSPTIRCPVCTGPHGGSKGDMCPSCDAKANS